MENGREFKKEEWKMEESLRRNMRKMEVRMLRMRDNGREIEKEELKVEDYHF